MKFAKKSLCIGIILLCLLSIGFIGGASADSTVTASFTTAPSSGTAPLVVSLDASASSFNDPSISKDNLTYAWSCDSEEGWEFASPTAKTTTATFSKAGQYTITLTVTNKTNSGDSATIDKEITVTDPVPINEVSISLDSPVRGATKTGATISPTEKVDIHTVTWSPSLTNNKFAGNTNYTATIILNAKSGYVFSDSTAVTLNGVAITGKSFSNNNMTITITKTFQKTEAELTKPTISTFTVSPEKGSNPLDVTITYATTGATQCYLVINSKNTTLSSTSGTEKKTLESDGTYTIKLVAINTNGTVEKSKTITVDKPIATVYIDGLTAPATDATPDTTATTTTTGIASISVKWNTTDGGTVTKFAAATAYKATITVTATAGYTFNSSKPTVYVSNVDGKLPISEETLSNSNTVLTIVHTYPATAATSGPVITLTIDPANPTIASNADSVMVTFKYSIEGEPTGSKLSFGDGEEVELGATPIGTKTHYYKKAGSYEATMRSTNTYGQSTKTISVKVTKEGLNADFTASPITGTAPLKVSVSDTSTGNVLSRSWDFDDGSIETAKTTSHTYEKAGDYIITLTVTDGQTTSKKTQIIKVSKSDSSTKTPSEVDYDPLMIIGDTEIPSPIDIIAEFVRMIKSIPELLTSLLHGA